MIDVTGIGISSPGFRSADPSEIADAAAELEELGYALAVDPRCRWQRVPGRRAAASSDPHDHDRNRRRQRVDAPERRGCGGALAVGDGVRRPLPPRSGRRARGPASTGSRTGSTAIRWAPWRATSTSSTTPTHPSRRTPASWLRSGRRCWTSRRVARLARTRSTWSRSTRLWHERRWGRSKLLVPGQAVVLTKDPEVARGTQPGLPRPLPPAAELPQQPATARLLRRGSQRRRIRPPDRRAHRLGR